MFAVIIDRFDDVFTRYIDSGFDLLGPGIDHVIILLIAFDGMLAGFLWMRKVHREATSALLGKALSAAALTIVVWNRSLLTQILANSYASLGLPPTPSADHFLHPGQFVQTGIEVGSTLLAAAEQLQIASLSEHFAEILIFLVTASAVVGVFFILALRMLLLLFAFKVAALAGFVLIPFGICGRAGELAEKMLGAAVAAAIKALVLTVIVGLGTVLFSHFVHGRGAAPSLDDALMEMLGALALLTLGVFGTESVCRLINDVLRRRGADVPPLFRRPRGALRNPVAPVRRSEYPADLVRRNAPSFGKRDLAAIHRILNLR